MDQFQKKEQDYAKWDQSIWLSVEKEISPFQSKVTECMIGLGQLKKQKPEDFQVEPFLEGDTVLGEQLYLELIRPVCVLKGYLPKALPTQQDLKEDDDSDEDSEENEKKEKKQAPEQKKEQKTKEPKKTGAKKGSKNNQGNAQADNKIRIIKENFTNDFEQVLSTHSLERMQVEYSFKNKKLQVKLVTFFYIAHFIKKNKEKLKIDQSQVFELINILMKIVRIFDKFKGRSFLNLDDKKKKNEQDLKEIAPSLILDLKMCIKGLKQYYKYTNKKIIINYPKLVYYTNYDRFFPTLDIKPYKSQIDFILAVKKAFNPEKGTLSNPTLVLYKTMIGSGKTSASLSLSNLINDTKHLDEKNSSLQVLYSCLISSVRVQVGRYAYNKNQKFALAAMQKAIKDEDYYYPRIINSYKYGNEKIVDLVISDLDCTYQMLDKHHYSAEEQDIINFDKTKRKNIRVGQLEKDNIVLFIDEPTAFCKDINSPATRKLFQILGNHPPKLIIMASATMPPVEQLSNTIKLIAQKNPGLQTFQVESKEFQIGCQYSSFNGEIIFPHTGIKTKEQLERIIQQIDKNPFLMRLYTGPSLYFLLKKCENAGIKNLPKIDELPEIKQAHISLATLKILKNLLKYDNSKIEEVCRMSADEANLDYKALEKEEESESDDIFGEEEGEQKEKPKQEEKGSYVNFKNMLREDAHKFLGGCLIATDNPMEFAKAHFQKWMKLGKKQYIKPVRRLLDNYLRDVEILEKEIKALEDDPDKDKKQGNPDKKKKKKKQDDGDGEGGKEDNERGKDKNRGDNLSKELRTTKLISKIQTEKEPKIEFPDYKRINTIDHYKRYCKDKQPLHLSMLINPVPIELVAQELIDYTDDFTLKLLFCGVGLYMEKGLSSKYLDKIEELASQNYLAYIITDRSLCYGTNFPISNVILCDDLATKLNMNEMFQLIGRAGRVGQSWTARAFLQEKGLEKLRNYIHSDDKKMSEEAEIFEAIAQEYLDHPQLALRTPRSEVKYIRPEKPDNRIELIIKKKNKQDYHIFRKVAVVPYLDDHRVLCKKMPYQSMNKYALAQTDILYEDMPTVLNSKQEPIIDVEGYYKNEQQFTRKTLDNACRRILKEAFEGKVSAEGQVNQFKAKVYEQFFTMSTNTFAIVIKCTQEVSHNGYSFQKMVSNPVDKFDDIMKEKLDRLVKLSTQLEERILSEPESILAADVKEIRQIHENLLDRKNFPIYSEMFKEHAREIEAEYHQLIDHVTDKTAMESSKQSIIALFAARFADFRETEDRLFHIDASVRKAWPKIVEKIQK